ncbi:MAG: phosphate ABC transporter permease subunit PstC [Oleiphilaceae bacterium]|nr:phosphate ABC transporter permease subunit PstC [Oleiphilaceae bacterium]
MRDQALRWVTGAAALLAGALLLLILAELFRASWPALVNLSVKDWLFSGQWAPSQGHYGLAAMLAASLAVSVLALAVAAPAGILIGAWLHLGAPSWVASPMRALQGVMAGIPSVVYGFWGLVTLVPLVNQWAPPGAVLITAVLVLALMILPLSVLVTDAALRQVPERSLQAARALALSRWGTFRNVMWPTVRGSIASGVVLQFGRALGETMAVLMVAGNVIRWPGSLTEPVRTVTANIALEMGYASGLHSQVLFLSGLLLMVFVLACMMLVRGGVRL